VFQGFVPRHKVDQKAAGNDTARLNEGRISWKNATKVEYFHRNVVFSNPDDGEASSLTTMVWFQPTTPQRHVPL
jgi:hypothetical protein